MSSPRFIERPSGNADGNCSETERTSSVIAEQDCTAWLLTPEKWGELQNKEPEIAKEMLKVGLKLSVERMNAITSYVLITAS